MIDINSVMILDVLNYDNWNTINDRATTIDLGSDKKFLHNIKFVKKFYFEFHTIKMLKIKLVRSCTIFLNRDKIDSMREYLSSKEKKKKGKKKNIGVKEKYGELERIEYKVGSSLDDRER